MSATTYPVDFNAVSAGLLLGRLVLGYEDGEVRIFAASIF